MDDFDKRYAEIQQKYNTNTFCKNLKAAFAVMQRPTLDLKWKIRHNFVGQNAVDESKKFTGVYLDQNEYADASLFQSQSAYPLYTSNIHVYTKNGIINNVSFTFAIDLVDLDSHIKHFDRIGNDIMDYCTSIATMHFRTIVYAIFGCDKEYLPLVDGGTMYFAYAMQTGKFEKEDLLEWNISIRQPNPHFPACVINADLWLDELIKK